MTKLVAVPAVMMLAASLNLGATSPPATAAPAVTVSGKVISMHLRAMVRHLPVGKHRHASSYDRDKDFGEWTDHAGGCDTRAVVLKAESLKPTTQNRYCTVETGKWVSYYNGVTYKYAHQLQIDHTVPVENAWVSGAYRWSQASRVAYYNDLGDGRTLVAVDSHDNEAKGDDDPTGWLPQDGKCRYVRSWVAVKTRWQLNVTRWEKTKLRRLASSCPNPMIKVHTAPVTTSPPPPPPPPPALTCQAHMSDATPSQYSYDRVIVRTAPRAYAHAVAHYKTTTTAHNGRANASGAASISFYISGATPGYRVNVSVTVTRNGQHRYCSTSFVPHT